MTEYSLPFGSPYNEVQSGKQVSVRVTGKALPSANANLLATSITNDGSHPAYIQVYFVASASGKLYVVRSGDSYTAREYMNGGVDIVAATPCTGYFTLDPAESANLRYTSTSGTITKLVIEDMPPATMGSSTVVIVGGTGPAGDQGPTGTQGPTGPPLAVGATGAIIYSNGTQWVSLTIGATGQALKSDGGKPIWQ